MSAQPELGTEAAMGRALSALRGQAGMDTAFGAKVQADGRAMKILGIRGALTQSLAGLTVASGAGLGGKSLVLRRPTRVRDYLAAKGITHDYDHAVSQEQLRTVVAVPVRVDSAARYVIYLGNRTQLELGDRWLDGLGPYVRAFERALAVQDEVQRQLRLVAPRPGERPLLSVGELREIACELAALAGEVVDDGLKKRLQALQQRVAPGLTAPGDGQPTVGLAPREIAVLEQVAAGYSNADVAERLGLQPSTVKSYLKSAMRTLGVNNRVQAIVAARAAGAIR